jgi:hypothetical protein
MNINLSSLLATIFSPVISYLKEKGLWDTLVSIYDTVSGIVTSLWSWLSANVDLGKVVNWIVPLIKFSLNIFLTLLDVLSKIINWVLGLFK